MTGNQVHVTFKNLVVFKRSGYQGSLGPTSEEFKLALERWTDIDLKTPGAIVLAATEDDVVKTVKFAVEHRVPFVPKAGGHSAWSTIGSEGIIIDLSSLKKITVDKSAKAVQVQAGVINKELIQALFDDALCVPLGGGNTIGSIPQALGGGICPLYKICGNTAENIISARLITAAGELVTVDSSTPDLLWALKGAGQFFGLVTEISLQAYPLSILGTDDGTVWSGMFIFDILKVEGVAKAVETLVNKESEQNAACLCIIVTNPHSGTPCMMLMAFCFGPKTETDKYFGPIKALNPMMATGEMVKYTDMNNGIDAFCVKGGFKRFKLAGLPRFDATPWPKVAELYVDLVKACPDAKTGGYGFEWVSGKKEIQKDSAWAHGDVKCWAESLSWYTNPESGPEIDKFEGLAIATATQSFKEEEIHTYQNFSRDTSLESRFGSKERVEKLRALKKKWDPTGVFTKQLL